MENINHTFKQGEVGKVLNFWCRDAEGLFDLSDWTVTLAVSLNGESVLTDEPVTVKDQTTNLGECFHTLNATSAALDPNVNNEKYDAELKTINGSNKFYWPVDPDGRRTYFKLEVQAPLS